MKNNLLLNHSKKVILQNNSNGGRPMLDKNIGLSKKEKGAIYRQERRARKNNLPL